MRPTSPTSELPSGLTIPSPVTTTRRRVDPMSSTLRAATRRGSRALSGSSMRTMSGTQTDQELAKLVRMVTEAAEALIRGDIDGYLARIKHADDYTLMSPYGGDPTRGFDDSNETRARLAQFFRGGDATVEVVATHASGDLAVLAVIERQRGTVGDLPEQDWSLRVTWVFSARSGFGVGARASPCGRARTWHRPRAARSVGPRRVTESAGATECAVPRRPRPRSRRDQGTSR